MAHGPGCAMVGAMSRLSRKLLRYAAAAALFVCGVAILVAGWPAAYAWTLIVFSLACAAQFAGPTLAGPRSEPRHGGAGRGEPRVAERRHRAESLRSLSGPR